MAAMKDTLKEKFAAKYPIVAAEVKSLIKDHGDFVLGSYTIEQVYQGMKGQR